MSAYLTILDSSIGFVLTALLVCAVTAAIIVRLIDRATTSSRRARFGWAALLAVVAGVGVWTTHFVAMLGYRPDLRLSFEPGATLVSGLVGVLLVGVPLAAVCHARTGWAKALFGALAGLGVGAMHFSGMRALENCLVSYSAPASMLALGLAALAFGAAAAKRGGSWARGGLIVIGVCGLHFGANAGMSLEMFGPAAPGRDQVVLTVLIAFASLMLSAAAFAVIDTAGRLETQGRAAARERAKHHALLAAALHNMSNGLVMIGADGRIHLFNERVRELFGLSVEDVAVGMPLATYLENVAGHVGWSRARTQGVIRNHRTWMARTETTRLEHRLDDQRVMAVACRPLPGGGGMLTYDDVTEQRAARAALEHLAYHDALTGLPNRRSFLEEIQRCMCRPEPGVVLMLDLDRFKQVNDTLGHPVGDALLVAVADRLRATCRPEDRVFRLGGDELAVLPAEVTAEDARALGERVVASLRESFVIEGNCIRIGCSLGIALAEPGDRHHQLVQKADMALYRAKETGRDRVEVYAPGMMEQAAVRRNLELDLARAVESQAFQLLYQPLVALPNRRLIGFEALIRWRHPQLGEVPPAVFIPLAEETGLISEIGRWALNEACAQAAGWPAHIHVAVNVSAAQLRSAAILDFVAEALARHGLAAGRLELELTETAIVRDGAAIAETLRTLRRRGVKIAMDDFGTGYSSLAHLRDFELDRIKIDRSFIEREAEESGARAVVRAIVGMGADLSILTTGEGVETEAQLERLIALGCDGAQGYLFGRPMLAADAARLIAVRAFEEDAAADRAAARAEGPAPGSRVA